jgi:hypothetical protein
MYALIKQKLYPSYGFPDYYGGSYINEKGYLVIKLTEISQETQKKIVEITGNKDIIFIPTKYSMRQIIEVFDVITSDKYNVMALEFKL